MNVKFCITSPSSKATAVLTLVVVSNYDFHPNPLPFGFLSWVVSSHYLQNMVFGLEFYEQTQSVSRGVGNCQDQCILLLARNQSIAQEHHHNQIQIISDMMPVSRWKRLVVGSVF